ncbi:hypothetical protein PPL_02438 [Heterostelium album PN500]|uniref:Uncharacterized protein n=1 Tax=Heterostelium pallidum (strain ATCC 26659 / Pp 5 / PN500) TaxID=670386 RepID=D3AZQ4_HETP5|nr:hypothetical protein PPL_02438 [Heterostelium album PN500]EFA85433.1 hypothetical protein PPL_02438 [Heterostelium album PN500]|eukprot:XP_020437542.1 hypothetical protein PPL_02438 [Heterostelium album PN500]
MIEVLHGNSDGGSIELEHVSLSVQIAVKIWSSFIRSKFLPKQFLLKNDKLMGLYVRCVASVKHVLYQLMILLHSLIYNQIIIYFSSVITIKFRNDTL